MGGLVGLQPGHSSGKRTAPDADFALLSNAQRARLHRRAGSQIEIMRAEQAEREGQLSVPSGNRRLGLCVAACADHLGRRTNARRAYIGCVVSPEVPTASATEIPPADDALGPGWP